MLCWNQEAACPLCTVRGWKWYLWPEKRHSSSLYCTYYQSMGGGCTYLRYNIVDPCSKLKDFNSKDTSWIIFWYTSPNLFTLGVEDFFWVMFIFCFIINSSVFREKLFWCLIQSVKMVSSQINSYLAFVW